MRPSAGMLNDSIGGLVGGDGIPIETFLSDPVANWVEAGSVE
jgi:hypothetical protein